MKKPILGICVGMQILFSQGVEHGVHPGVGIWNATVEKLEAPILPHMGWNTIEPSRASPLLARRERQRAELLALQNGGLLQRGGHRRIALGRGLVANLRHRLLDGGLDGELHAIGGCSPIGVTSCHVGLGAPGGEQVAAHGGPDGQQHSDQQHEDVHAVNYDKGLSQSSRIPDLTPAMSQTAVCGRFAHRRSVQVGSGADDGAEHGLELGLGLGQLRVRVTVGDDSAAGDQAR